MQLQILPKSKEPLDDELVQERKKEKSKNAQRKDFLRIYKEKEIGIEISKNDRSHAFV